ncbi:MAG: hypothetical protein AB1487_08835 [Thermodesulfobacteriota bacterium]
MSSEDRRLIEDFLPIRAVSANMPACRDEEDGAGRDRGCEVLRNLG